MLCHRNQMPFLFTQNASHHRFATFKYNKTVSNKTYPSNQRQKVSLIHTFKGRLIDNPFINYFFKQKRVCNSIEFMLCCFVNTH